MLPYDVPELEYAQFVIEDSPTVSGYHYPDLSWNGWAMPTFSFNAIADWLDETKNTWWFDENFDAIAVQMEDGIELFYSEQVCFHGRILKVYPVGISAGWCWEKAES